jgi:HD-GYP domain-containing protein (c-di-GMP phosphodiesterase class II)
MNERQICVVAELANGLIKANRDVILRLWLKSLEEESSLFREKELVLLSKEFEALIDDFIFYISKGDIKGYLKANALAAESIAYNDIPFSNFLEAFHLFEDSYMPLLFQQTDIETILCINSLDRLHHKTISIICEKYFEVKDNTINALANLIGLRDDETGDHIERTRIYSIMLAKEMGCSTEFINSIYKASLLHDVGKIGISDNILLKPGKLSSEEFHRMKEHTRIGAQTLEKVIGSQAIHIGYLPMAREIALYHHEKYDGTGYPQGLKHEEIPLAARIVAVVDAYDAIVSERPYKEALSHEEAVRRIKDDSGRHFDPLVVEAFLGVSEDFRKIHLKYDGIAESILKIVS